MSVTADRPAPPDPSVATGPGTRPRRLPDWRRVPYAAHVAAAAVLMLLLVTALGSSSIINVDEGAYLSQARVLDQQGQWGEPNPNPTIDVENRWYPVDASESGGDRWYPYTKHVLYPVLVRLLHGAGGLMLVLQAHALAVVAAGATVGLVTRRVARRAGQPEHLDRVALWTLVVGTPAFFDGYWVIAHGPALAASAVATYGVVRAVEDRRLVSGLALAAAGTAIAALLRSEGTLFGLSLAGALGLWWLADRGRWEQLAASVAVGGGAVASYLGEGIVERRIRPGGGAPFVIVDEMGWLEGRFRGFNNSILRPDLVSQPVNSALVLTGALGTVVAWGMLRRDPRLARKAAVVAAAALAVRALRSDEMIPGLAMAAPVLVAGLCTIDRTTWSRGLSRTLLLAGAAFASAVIATQYWNGGSGEWGGRYFRLGLALVVPVLVVTLRARLDAVSRPTARVVLGALVASALALSTAVVVYVHHSRDLLSTTIEAIHAEAADAGGGRPLVVSLRREFGRFSWEYADRTEMLYVKDLPDLPDVAEALAADGVDGFLLLADQSDVDRATDGLSSQYEPVPGDEAEPRGWSTLRFRRR